MQGIKATKQHCKFCFDCLVSHFSKKGQLKWPEGLPDAEVPIFVTWKKQGNLRGCIGTFSPDQLSKILPQYTLISALNDTRFKPMAEKELPDLSVGISLLVNFEEGKGAYDWEVGKHGIILKANLNGRKYSATYLPEVASEQGWSKKQALESLAEKGGYHGDFATLEPHIKLTTYESSKESMTYEEYKKM